MTIIIDANDALATVGWLTIAFITGWVIYGFVILGSISLTPERQILYAIATVIAIVGVAALWLAGAAIWK